MTAIDLFAGMGETALPSGFMGYNGSVRAVLPTPSDVATNLAGGDCEMQSNKTASRHMYQCHQCGTTFKSYNPTPKFCSRACKDSSLIARIDVDKAIRLYEAGMSQDEVAVELGTSQKVIANAFRRRGYVSRPPVKRNQWRGNNSNWRGGRTTHEGYALIYKPGHHRARANGYVPEHILIAEKKLGRRLRYFGPSHPDSEIVHHVNGVKDDNRPENLMVVSPAEHADLHRGPDGALVPAAPQQGRR